MVTLPWKIPPSPILSRDWSYRLLIRLPDFVNEKMLKEAVDKVKANTFP
ncbi:MAG: hypothetical protein ACI9IP_001020 [Arcticibacterium sp.]|jgi:hypothetical protein